MKILLLTLFIAQFVLYNEFLGYINFSNYLILAAFSLSAAISYLIIVMLKLKKLKSGHVIGSIAIFICSFFSIYILGEFIFPLIYLIMILATVLIIYATIMLLTGKKYNLK